MKGVHKPLICCAAFAIFLLVATHAGLAFTNAPAIGESLPPFKLLIPQDARAERYLGLSGPGQFTIAQIEAKVVIIQIFSMYCPVCQKEAFRVNKLYSTIQKRKDLKDKIKMIGIGTGNTPFEVGFFQKKYEVDFPLFSDENLSIHQILGELRTPYFIGVKINRDGSTEVFYSRLGQFRDVNSFLKRIVELSGL
ncbi:MAG: redoxin domain-containing protein [Deltaproteobacteria bacterium]|nr:redoxin domain-containing protein [Deltaproteobacteria bacterium]